MSAFILFCNSLDQMPCDALATCRRRYTKLSNPDVVVPAEQVVKNVAQKLIALRGGQEGALAGAVFKAFIREVPKRLFRRAVPEAYDLAKEGAFRLDLRDLDFLAHCE